MWNIFSHQCRSVWGKVFCVCSSKKHNYFKKKEKNLPNLFISSLCRRSFTRIDKGTFFFSNWESELFEVYFHITFQISKWAISLSWCWFWFFVWQCVYGMAQRAFYELGFLKNSYVYNWLRGTSYLSAVAEISYFSAGWIRSHSQLHIQASIKAEGK